MEEQLRAFLLANVALTALVGSRITWAARPQATALPALALHLISGPRDYHMKGRTNLIGYLVQVDCWAGSYGAAKAVGRAAEAALASLTTAPFQAAFIENERASFEEGEGPDASGASDFYRTSLDVRVWHQPE